MAYGESSSWELQQFFCLHPAAALRRRPHQQRVCLSTSRSTRTPALTMALAYQSYLSKATWVSGLKVIPQGTESLSEDRVAALTTGDASRLAQMRYESAAISRFSIIPAVKGDSGTASVLIIQFADPVDAGSFYNLFEGQARGQQLPGVTTGRLYSSSNGRCPGSACATSSFVFQVGTHVVEGGFNCDLPGVCQNLAIQQGQAVAQTLT
jgi:hypothetical protein